MRKQRKEPAGRNRRAPGAVRRIGAGFLFILAILLLLWKTGSRLQKLPETVQLDREWLSYALLQAELGHSIGGKMSLWESIVLSQSAALQAGRDVVQAEPSAPSASPAQTEPEASPSPTVQPSSVSTPPPTSNQDVVAKTLQPIASTNYDQADGVYIFNRTKQKVNVAELSQSPPDLQLKPEKEGPQVLIIHTHGSEAYHPEGEDLYTATGESRTTDVNYNVVRVGNELQQVLEANGISVIHDTTLYDYPSYQGSYERSIVSVQSYLKQYPTVRVVLDLHRDALVGSNGTIYKPVTNIDGEQVAQVMIVLGSNDGGLSHPNWKENVRFAVWLQKRLNAEYPTLARPMSLRTSRYNQQLSTGSILIEVGSHGNSLQEALGAVRLLGTSLSQLLKEWGG